MSLDSRPSFEEPEQLGSIQRALNLANYQLYNASRLPPEASIGYIGRG